LAATCPLQKKYKNIQGSAEDHFATNVKHEDYDAGFIGTDIIFCAAVVD
jgi:hypothetical protein